MIALSRVGLDRPKLRRTALFVVSIGFPVIAAAVLAQWRVVLVGAMIGMMLSFSDDDGPLPARLAMLALVTVGMAAGSIAGHLLGSYSTLFWPFFLAAAFAAGWLYRARRGTQLAARVCAIALSIVAGLSEVAASELEMIGATVAVCALARTIDHLLFGPLPRGAAGAPLPGPANAAQWLRFALAYAAAASRSIRPAPSGSPPPRWW